MKLNSKYRKGTNQNKYENSNPESNVIHKTENHHHNHKIFLCRNSGKKYKTKKLHLQYVHSDLRPFPCPLDKKSFKTKAELFQHILKHINERRYQCNYCNKGFRQKCTYYAHLKHHTQKRRIKCEKCTKQFNRNSDLRNHMMIIHTKKSKFLCRIWKYSAPAPSDESPYKCKECGKQFGWKEGLKSHMRIHKDAFGLLLKIKDVGNLVNNLRVKYGSGSCDSEGWNPIQIEDTSQLLKLIKIQSTAEPFHCTKCGHLSGTIEDLNHHMKIHDNFKEFECNICGTEFGHQRDLFRHYNTHFLNF